MNQFLHTLCFTVIFMPFFYCSGLNWQKSHQVYSTNQIIITFFFFASAVHLYIYAGSGFAQALPHSPFFKTFFLVTFLIFTCATTTHKRMFVSQVTYHLCYPPFPSHPIILTSSLSLSLSSLSLSVYHKFVCFINYLFHDSFDCGTISLFYFFQQYRYY